MSLGQVAGVKIVPHGSLVKRGARLSASASALALGNLLALWIERLCFWSCGNECRGEELWNFWPKIQLDRLLFSHEEIKEKLKLRKCPAILPSNLVCLHGALWYWDDNSTMCFSFFKSNFLLTLWFIFVMDKGKMVGLRKGLDCLIYNFKLSRFSRKIVQ